MRHFTDPHEFVNGILDDASTQDADACGQWLNEDPPDEGPLPVPFCTLCGRPGETHPRCVDDYEAWLEGLRASGELSF